MDPPTHKKRKFEITADGRCSASTAAPASTGRPRPHPPGSYHDNDDWSKLEDDLINIVKSSIQRSKTRVFQNRIRRPVSNEKKALQARILETKDDLTALSELREKIDDTIVKFKETKEDELSASFDLSSPLLSLDRPIVSNIMGFLDEDALFQCESASYTLNVLARSHGHWKRLHEMRLNPVQSPVENPDPPDEEIYQIIRPNTILLVSMWRDSLLLYFTNTARRILYRRWPIRKCL